MNNEDRSRERPAEEPNDLRKQFASQQVDKGLGESGTNFRLVVENAGEGILVAQDGKLRFVNPKMEELTGYSARELTSKAFTEFLHPDDRARVLENHQKRLRGELTPAYAYQFRILAKDGSIKWVDNKGALTTWEGRPATVNFLSDITDRINGDRALRESEAKYRLVVENAGEGILVAQDGMLKFVNPWMVALGGYTAGELLGKPFSVFVHPEDREMVYQQHLRRLKGELPMNFVYNFRILTKSGGVLWVEMKGAPTTWEGRPASVNFVFDISQRKQAEDSLHYRAAFEKLIMTLSTDFINFESDLIDSGINHALQELGAFIGADRSYVFQFSGNGAMMSNTHEWCAAGIEPYRHELQDIPVDTAMPWFAKRIKALEVFHVPSVADLPPEAAAVDHGDADERLDGFPFELPLFRRGLIGFLGFDSVRIRKSWSDDAIFLLRIAGEMLANALMRKQVEDALRHSEARFRSNFEQAAVGIVDCTLAGGFIWVNRRFCDFTGYSAEELRSLTFREITHSEDRERELQEYQKVLQGKALFYTLEKRYVRKDRAVVWANLSMSLVRDADGVPRRFIGVVEDITYRKRMEDELFKAQKLESLGILAGGIAHDFNNMLTAIVGQIGVSRMHLPPGDALGKRLEEVEKAALKAKGLTQQLLTFAKGGAPIKNALSLKRLVCESTRLVLSGTNITYSLTDGDQVWSVDADENQIGQALNNLLINACQAMPDGGTIQIGLQNSEVKGVADLPLKKGRYVKLTVADHGIGIPLENLSKIFDPYFTTKEKGTGLGLAVSYSIIRNHGGHILVESEPGVGTTFTVYLPASDRTAADVQHAQDHLVRGSGRVLVMDDEEMVRLVTGELLGELGYEVEFAHEGGEAIERYRKAKESGRPFDVVIMDLTIAGGMGGKDAIRKLLEYDPDAKAIVSSGYSNDPIMANFRDHGFRDVMVKPYKTIDLSRKLHALMTAGQ